MPVLPDRHPPPQPSLTPAQAELAAAIADILRSRPDLLPARDKGPRGWGPGVDEYRPLAAAVADQLLADGWTVELGPPAAASTTSLGSQRR